jgi:lipopolysaccharide/colanic/teichoic acid biosynthesis glycosyltransferase
MASRFDFALKRAIDVAVSFALLIFLLPVWILFCLAIKLESPGPIFYRARRVGWRGKALRVLKFRKMHDGATGTALTGNEDPRFTRLGRFLARTKLDEVPQLLNVLRGEMSLVGPRPEDPSFVALHDDEYEEINAVRPGITGLGQLAFARESEILDPGDAVGHYVGKILPQKVGLDLLYSRTRTLRGDFRILLWTVMPVILRVDVAVNRETGALTVRRRKRSLGTTPSSS